MNLPNFSLKNLFLPQCNYFSPLTSKSLIIVLDLSINAIVLSIIDVDLIINVIDLTLSNAFQPFCTCFSPFLSRTSRLFKSGSAVPNFCESLSGCSWLSVETGGYLVCRFYIKHAPFSQEIMTQLF